MELQMLKKQRFGLELEFTGITRQQAARAMAEHFGSTARHTGGTYDEWMATDRQGRAWKVVNDSSIQAESKQGRTYSAYADTTYRCEMVTPVLEYKDIKELQEVVRKIRKAGAKVNDSCGIHIHVDGQNHNAKSIRHLLNLVYRREEQIYRSLEVKIEREYRYAKRVNEALVQLLDTNRPQTTEALALHWYTVSGSADGRRQHYHPSRYHGLNLHSYWYRGTVEFRLFNATLHAGEVKAYVQMCLGMSARAIEARSISYKRPSTPDTDANWRAWLYHIGLYGEEFNTARLHLTKVVG